MKIESVIDSAKNARFLWTIILFHIWIPRIAHSYFFSQLVISIWKTRAWISPRISNRARNIANWILIGDQEELSESGSTLGNTYDKNLRGSLSYLTGRFKDKYHQDCESFCLFFLFLVFFLSAPFFLGLCRPSVPDDLFCSTLV